LYNDQRRPRLKVWGHPNLAAVDPKEKAMWLWANVENLDNFLKDVYTYFLGNGMWSILLNRALSLLYVVLFLSPPAITNANELFALR
jgi:autophagy-related protein 9